MNVKNATLTALFAAILAAGCESSMSGSGPTTQQIEASWTKLDALPPTVKLAGQRETEGGVIRSVTKSEFESHDLYTIKYTTASGKAGKIQTLSDGRVLSREVEQKKLTLPEMPDAVRVATMTHTGNVKPESIVEAEWGGEKVYVVTVHISDKAHQLTFDQNGSLLKEQSEIEEKQIPVRASAALLSRFPDLRIKDVSEVRVGPNVFYEVVGKSSDKKRIINMTADGMFKSVTVE